MYEKTILDNGLRVLSSCMPHTRSVAVGLFLGVGSRYEPDEVGGVFHFIEHMLFKGTQKRPTPKEIAVAIEGVGGEFNAATGREITSYWLKVAQPHLSLALDVLVDVLRHSLFDPGEIEKERNVIIEEINMTRDTPDDWVFALANELRWPNHPLGRDIAGSKESVERISRNAMLAYMADHYRPANAVVAVAGNVEHGDVVARLTDLLGSWEAGPVPTCLPYADGQQEPQVNVSYRDIEQAHFVLTLPGLDQNHPDRFVLQTLNVLLGQGMSSRLFLEIRENRGLAYSVYSFHDHFQDTGVVGVYAGVDPERMAPALRAVLDELDRLRQEPVSEEELTRVKEYIKGRLLLRMEDTYAVAAWLAGQEVTRGQVLTVDEVIGAVEVVTSDDLQAMAQRIFRAERLNLAAVGPIQNDQERFADLLWL